MIAATATRAPCSGRARSGACTRAPSAADPGDDRDDHRGERAAAHERVEQRWVSLCEDDQAGDRERRRRSPPRSAPARGTRARAVGRHAHRVGGEVYGGQVGAGRRRRARRSRSRSGSASSDTGGRPRCRTGYAVGRDRADRRAERERREDRGQREQRVDQRRLPLASAAPARSA